LAPQDGFAEMRDAHNLAWTHIWDRLSIEIDGHPEELQMLRLHLMHLMQTVSRHSEDLDMACPRGACTGRPIAATCSGTNCSSSRS
jgi:trehalose/maltose hydrolase-like predicted phosphorylase